MTAPAEIARLKITLDDVEPKVVRRVEVPLSIRLDRLHAVLQAALGWTDSHLWEFRAGETGWGIPDPDWDDGPANAAKTTLLGVLGESGAKKLTYLYDFGDGWWHTVRIERIAAPEPGAAYPRLIEATGSRPPQDIGCPPGHDESLQWCKDPGHERHAEFTRWHDADFDLKVVESDVIDQQLAMLVKRWLRRPSKSMST